MNSIVINGELLDGYHIEQLPQFNTDNQVDMNALSSIAGMRAVWLLYFLGLWDHLEDLGVDRSEVEPVLKRCCTRYGRRLTARQAQQLQKKVPVLVDASKELRLAYALKSLDRDQRQLDHSRVGDHSGPLGKKKPERKTRMTQQPDMYIYHAEVPSAAEANEIVTRHTPQIEAAGGTIEAGHAIGRGGSIIMVKLPASLEVDPQNVLPGSGLKFSAMRAQVVAIPKDMGPDPRPAKER